LCTARDLRFIGRLLADKAGDIAYPANNRCFRIVETVQSGTRRHR